LFRVSDAKKWGDRFDNICFCDRLRRIQLAKEYEQTKHAARDSGKVKAMEYNLAKTAFINQF
jgi:hypothetical protein